MALGSNYNQQNNNQQNNFPTYYSRLRIRSGNFSIGFSFWNGTMKIIISEFNNGASEDRATIYMSPNKARLMSECIQKILSNPDTPLAYGVDTGTGEVRGIIIVGRDENSAYLIIGKINNNGDYEGNPQRFNFVKDYNYILQFANPSDVDIKDFKKENSADLDLEYLRDILADFSRYMNGAAGYATQDVNRYEAGRLLNIVKGGNNSHSNFKKSGDGFFSGSNNDSSSSTNNGSESSQRKNTYKNIDNIEDEFDV